MGGDHDRLCDWHLDGGNGLDLLDGSHDLDECTQGEFNVTAGIGNQRACIAFWCGSTVGVGQQAIR